MVPVPEQRGLPRDAGEDAASLRQKALLELQRRAPDVKSQAVHGSGRQALPQFHWPVPDAAEAIHILDAEQQLVTLPLQQPSDTYRPRS